MQFKQIRNDYYFFRIIHFKECIEYLSSTIIILLKTVR